MTASSIIAKRLKDIEVELSKPLPSVIGHRPTKRKAKMVTKKKTPVKKAVKKVVKTKVKATTKALKVAKPKNPAISLKELAEAAGLDGQQARYKLRKAGIDKPEGRFWEWTRKSDIKRVEKALAA